MKNDRGKQEGPPRAPKAETESGNVQSQLETAVRERRALLESYAPRWYTFELRKRVETALRIPQGHHIEEVFLEVHSLLETHAPTWYGEEQHKRGERLLQTLKKNRKERAKRASA